MKVLVANFRLALECQVKNLSEIPESKLRDVAAKYQIGWGRFVEKQVPVMSRGVMKMQTERIMEPKPRKVLEDEIRKRLTISLIVPKEYWTPEQEDAFMSNGLIDEKDINKEKAVKLEAKIDQDIPPYEQTKDKFAQMKMLAELTEMQWDYFREYYNTKIELKKDEDGRIIGREKRYVHRLRVEEYIPENEEDEVRLKEMNEKKGKVASDEQEG